MSDLKTAVEELMGVVENLDVDSSEAINDDVATIGILTGGKLSPGQLQDDEIQWVLAHLFGDISEALESEDVEDEDLDEAMSVFADAVKKAIGEVKDHDLKEQLDLLVSEEEDDSEDE
jgi:hypothetical protein